ncbi:MAG: 50S ribosomal protein L7ae-like protein [Clostridiales bacterium]|nr:50S ribosomal protein L7ae-like protein [Clostridiales bacterium]
MNRFFNFLGLVKRSGNLLEGYSKCDEGRNKKDIYLFILSQDASESTIKKFIKHCERYKIPYIKDFSKEDLGDSIGRLEVKILGVLDKNMSDKLLSIYMEEKSMG